MNNKHDAETWTGEWDSAEPIATERTSLPLPAEILSDERSTPDGPRDKSSSSCPSCRSFSADLASLKAELQHKKDQEVHTRMSKPEMSATQPTAERNEPTPHDAKRTDRIVASLIAQAKQGCTGTNSVYPFTCPNEREPEEWCPECLAQEAAREIESARALGHGEGQEHAVEDAIQAVNDAAVNGFLGDMMRKSDIIAAMRRKCGGPYQGQR